MKRLLTLAVLMLGVSTSAYAQDYGKTIIDFLAGGGAANPTTETSLLSTLSFYLNFIALAMMAWLAVIGSATFIIQTANKGTPGGQVISSFWMPIRICAATILLIPGTNGYSALQYGVLTVAEKGNEVGNTVMAAGLDYIYNNGVYRSPSLEDGSALIMAWVASEVCHQYIDSYTRDDTITPNLRSRQEDGYLVTEMGYDWNERAGTPSASNPRTNYCGNISFRVEDSITESSVIDSILTTSTIFGGNDVDMSDPVYAAPAEMSAKFAQIMTEIQPKVASIASKILHDEGALRALQENGSSYQSAFESARKQTTEKINQANDDFQSVVAAYNSKVQGMAAAAVNEVITKENNGESWKEEVVAAGWPALGTVFWQVQMSQMQINGVAKSFAPYYLPPNPDNSFASDTRYAEIIARIEALRKKYATQKTSSTAISPNSHSLSAIADAGAEGSGAMDKFKSMLFNAVATPYKAMLHRNGDDLIINMQYFGSIAGATADSLYWLKVLAKATISAATHGAEKAADGAKSSAEQVPLVGGFLGAAATAITATTAAASAFAQSVAEDTAGMLNMVVFYLIVVAFILGIMLPTIPLIHWLMGVISWMLFFIECTLVSPMWLAAHGTAEKEGWGSEHTRQGYMLMIGLFLAPTLRVVGFLAIFLALKPLGALANWMIDYINGVIVSGFISPFMILGSMAAVTIFCYTAMSRVFTLPSELFERGLRWINGGQEVTGDSSAEKESRHSIAAFSSKTEHAGIHGAGGQGKKAITPTQGTPTPTKK